jgi:hypothetical protein
MPQRFGAAGIHELSDVADCIGVTSVYSRIRPLLLPAGEFAVQCLDQGLDGQQPAELTALLVEHLVLNVKPLANLQQHSNDLGRLAFSQQVDLKIQMRAPVRLLLRTDDKLDVFGNALRKGSLTLLRHRGASRLSASAGMTVRLEARTPKRPAAIDHGTARFASKLIGEREVLREQVTNSCSGGPFFASDHHVTESAVLPSNIEQLPDVQESGDLHLTSGSPWMGNSGARNAPTTST